MSVFFGFLTFVFAVALLVGAIKPSLVKLNSRMKVLTHLGGATIVCVLLALLLSPNPSVQSDTNPGPVKEEMNLEIRSTFNNLTIKNLNSFDWSDCEVEVNGKYKMLRKVALYTPQSLQAEGSTGESVELSLPAFVDDEGKRFDIPTTVVTKVLVSCKQPYIGAYSGAF